MSSLTATDRCLGPRLAQSGRIGAHGCANDRRTSWADPSREYGGNALLRADVFNPWMQSLHSIALTKRTAQVSSRNLEIASPKGQ